MPPVIHAQDKPIDEPRALFQLIGNGSFLDKKCETGTFLDYDISSNIKLKWSVSAVQSPCYTKFYQRRKVPIHAWNCSRI